jgi:PKD repeat protein
MIGEVVTFTVDSALEVESWDFGEGDCQGNSPEFSCAFVPEGFCNNMQWTYPTAGVKSVTMRLVDGRSQIKMPTVQNVGSCCTADGPPDASFTIGGDAAYIDETVAFIDTSTNVGADAEPTEWHWTIYHDSVALFTSAEQHPFYVFDSLGLYLVELVVSNCLGYDIVTESLEVVEAQFRDVVFPAAVSLEGALGTQWESDFRFFNPCLDLMDVRIEFQPEGRNNAGADLSFREFTLDAAETKVFSGVFEAIPGLVGDEVTGSVRVESSSESGCKVLAVSRTFNETPEGTLGLFVPALLMKVVGEDRLDFTGLIHNDDYRTNLRLVSFGGGDVWVALTILDRNGNQLTPSRNVKVKGYSTRQLSEVASWLGIVGDLSLFSIQVSTSGAAIDGVATVIDNVTGDSVLYRSSFLNENKVWIAGVAHIFGLNEAQWRTDICLYNPTEGSLLGELEYVVGATPDDRYGLEWPALDSGAVCQGLDVAGFFMGGEETQGYLVFTGDGGLPAPQIAARTYNADPDGGTYGLSLPTFGSRALLKSGDAGFIVGISNSEDPYVGFRTNLGLLNTDSDSGAAVRITMFNLDGTVAGEPLDLWLPPGKMRQFQVFNMLGFRDVAMTASVQVEVLSGEGVAAYATEIDNRTNDSIYMPALKAVIGSPP